jgi:hypothetical protein
MPDIQGEHDGVTHYEHLDTGVPGTLECGDVLGVAGMLTRWRRDLDAVINGLTLEHNSGAVEGNVTRGSSATATEGPTSISSGPRYSSLPDRHVIIARAEYGDRLHQG